ncbi:hypothetical protein VPH35_044860 [Triticum aestivum]
MSQPRCPDGFVLPDAAVCHAHCCHPVKPASINGDAKAPDSVEIHQQWGNVNGRVTTKEEDEYCRFKFNSAEGDDLYLVFLPWPLPWLRELNKAWTVVRDLMVVMLLGWLWPRMWQQRPPSCNLYRWPWHGDLHGRGKERRTSSP